MQEPRPDDRIIEEVRRNRDELLRSAGGSIDALFAALKAAEGSEAREVVKLPPRRFGGEEAGGDCSGRAARRASTRHHWKWWHA